MKPQEPSSNVNPFPQTVCFTVDVEDYYMSPECIPFSAWESFPSCIHTGMERCLHLLDETGAKATFFYVGWLAERYPEIVRWAFERGHEIATHTYNHTFVTTLNEQEYEDSLVRSLDILRSIVPEADVIGHRAPAFSLERSKPWQADVLRRHGIRYDSSINPHSTYLYGEAGAPRFPYRWRGVLEMPPATLSLWGRTMPVGGGGTLRLYPSWYLRWARRRYLAEGHPPVIYMHPWEFVPEHPALDLPAKLRFVHWVGIRSVERKVRALLNEYRSVPMHEMAATYDSILPDESPSRVGR